LGNGQLSLEQARAVRAPTLAIAGGAARPFMRQTAEALARAVPDGRALVLEQATHDLSPELLAPPLLRFYAAWRAIATRRTCLSRRPTCDHAVAERSLAPCHDAAIARPGWEPQRGSGSRWPGARGRTARCRPSRRRRTPASSRSFRSPGERRRGGSTSGQ